MQPEAMQSSHIPRPWAAATSAEGQHSSSSARPGHREEVDQLILHDPILDLCPSLELLKQLSRSSHVYSKIKKDKLCRALLRAASHGDMDMLTWILDPKEEAREYLAEQPSSANSYRRSTIDFSNIKDDDGTGPVVLAACAGHIDAVAILITHGAQVDERDACGWTPLMWAINSSNLPLASFLLSRGADVEAKTAKGTTCEDFILSAAPESAGSSQPGPSGLSAPGAPRRLATTDSESIADLIYEHHRYLSVQQSAAQRLNSLGSPIKSRPGSASPNAEAISAVHGSPTLQRQSSSSYSTSPFKPGHSRSSSQLTSRRLIGRYERAHLFEQQTKRKEVNETRKNALADIAILLEVDYSTLIGELVAEDGNHGPAARRRRGAPKVVHADLASGCGAAEVGVDVLSVEFDWNTVRSDQMLVFGPSDIGHLLDMFVTKYKPVRAPWTSRAAPASVLFLCARYACYVQDEDLLEELFLGAIDRIEGVIYSHPTDMTYLAFWLLNSCLLHYYVSKDRTLKKSTSVREYRALLSDLINEVYMFIIRDAERRIDKVLDAAMLDHEAIPGFDEIRFEGEWKFMKTLTGSVKGIGQSSSFSQAMTSSSSSRTPISQIFGTRKEDPGALATNPSSPSSTAAGRSSNVSGSSTFGPSSYRPSSGSPTKMARDSFQSLREIAYNATASDLLNSPTPRTITSLLTSTLQILQFYEINPAIIVQALSQIFFWIGCELFNRVLSRKRYLCRSRAIQIRMNVSALEDWARSNALPLSIVHSQLAPLSQLISWLQCQSSLQEFDGLIGTMQGLKALTPVQLRKAVKDYRYEVGETKMSAECLQYLDQLIIDWKRRQDDQLRQLREETLAIQRRKKKFKKAASNHHRSGTATQKGQTPDSRSPSPEDSDDDENMGLSGNLKADTSLTSNASADTAVLPDGKEPLTPAEQITHSAQAMIDGLFAPGKSIADYVPPWTAAGPPLALHEDASVSPAAKNEGLLNSRDMLPFALPKNRNALIVTPGDSFGFGRGHFTGTGTPSLRSVNGDDSGSEVPSQASSRRSSVVSLSPSDSPSSASQTGGKDDGEDDGASVGGRSDHSDFSAASRTSSLFPQGKGLAAGAYWNPVPLLPDGMLDKINTLMRNVATLMPLEKKSRNIVHADIAPDSELPPSQTPQAPSIPTRASSTLLAKSRNDAGRSPEARESYFPTDEEINKLMGQQPQKPLPAPSRDAANIPPSNSVIIPSRDRSMRKPPTSSSPLKADEDITDEFGRHLGRDDDEVRTPGPYRQDTLKAPIQYSSSHAYSG